MNDIQKLTTTGIKSLRVLDQIGQKQIFKENLKEILHVVDLQINPPFKLLFLKEAKHFNMISLEVKYLYKHLDYLIFVKILQGKEMITVLLSVKENFT